MTKIHQITHTASSENWTQRECVCVCGGGGGGGGRADRQTETETMKPNECSPAEIKKIDS